MVTPILYSTNTKFKALYSVHRALEPCYYSKDISKTIMIIILQIKIQSHNLLARTLEFSSTIPSVDEHVAQSHTAQDINL